MIDNNDEIQVTAHIGNITYLYVLHAWKILEHKGS